MTRRQYMREYMRERRAMERRAFSPEELEEALFLQAHKYSYARIAHALGRSAETVRYHLSQRERDRLRELSRRRVAEIIPAWVHGSDQKKVEIPQPVLAERDRRLALFPRDLTAAICNDPLPGYSALERRA